MVPKKCFLTSQSDLLSNLPASNVARNSGYRTFPFLSSGTRLNILSKSFFSISSPNLDSSSAFIRDLRTSSVNHINGLVGPFFRSSKDRRSLTWNSFWVTTSLFSRSSLLKNSLKPCKEHFWTSMFRTSEFINSIRLNSGPDWFV